METMLFIPPDFVSPEDAAPKSISLTPRTKFLMLGALGVLAISGLLFNLIKTDKMTPTFLWQTLITLAFCGLGGFLYWRFPSRKYFFAEPVISYIEKGNLFSRMFSFLLRFCGVIVGVVAFVFWFMNWATIIHFPKYTIIGGILFQIIFLIGVYVAVHIHWIRAKTILNLGKSDFTIIPVAATLLKMTGELSACFFVFSGLGSGLMRLYEVPDLLLGMTPPMAAPGAEVPRLFLFSFLTPFSWISDSGRFLPALEIIGVGFAAGMLMLVLYYLASEILLVVFDIARNTRAIRDNLPPKEK